MQETEVGLGPFFPPGSFLRLAEELQDPKSEQKPRSPGLAPAPTSQTPGMDSSDRGNSLQRSTQPESRWSLSRTAVVLGEYGREYQGFS